MSTPRRGLLVGDRHDAAAIRLTLRPQGLLAPLDQPTSTPRGSSRRALVLPGFHAQGSPPGRAGYDYLGNRKTPRTGLSPAGSMLLWAAPERTLSPDNRHPAARPLGLPRFVARAGTTVGTATITCIAGRKWESVARSSPAAPCRLAAAAAPLRSCGVAASASKQREDAVRRAARRAPAIRQRACRSGCYAASLTCRRNGRIVCASSCGWSS